MKNAKTTLILVGIIFCSNVLFSQNICWKDLDPKNCQYSLITEFGITGRLNKVAPYSEQYDYLNNRPGFTVDLNVGANYHLNEKIALGAYGFVDIGTRSTYGLRSRLSYFPTDKIVLDISPGVIFPSSNYSYVGTKGGFSVEGGVNLKNYVGLYTRLDHVRRRDNTNDTAVNLGIKAGGVVGTVAAGGAAVGTVVIGGLVLLLIFAAFGGF